MATPATTVSTFDRRLLAGMALVVAAFAAYASRQTDPDMWGHLRYGRFFAENGLADLTDPFAYTSAGCEWHAHEWLAQWLLWQACALGGPVGLIFFKLTIAGATLFFLYRAIRITTDDARIWAPVLMLAACEVGRWFLFRPQMFTFCFFAYFLWVLFAHLHGKPARLWTLPLLLALWANLHAGFLAGLGAVGLTLLLRVAQALYRDGWQPHALARLAWPLALTLAGGAAATLLTPFGVGLWRYVLTEMTHDTNRLYIQEWMPLLSIAGNDWALRAVLLTLGTLVFAGVIAQLRSRSRAGLPPWLWLLACVPLAWMAFSSYRHVPMFILWAAPVLALLATVAAERWRGAPVWVGGWLVVTGLVLVTAVQTVSFTARSPALAIQVEPDLYPANATAYLRENNLRGNVFAPLEWGSYLTWELYPRVRVAMDGRNVTLFPSEKVRANLVYFLPEGPEYDAPFDDTTDYLLIPTTAPVLAALRRDAQWRELYGDDCAVLFGRADAGHASAQLK
jgi:hypothetical protein